MSTTQQNDPIRHDDPAATTDRPRTTSWWLHGLATFVVVAVVAVLGWFLLADPVTSPLGVYPLPFNAALFWALMFVVWTGFNLELAGFARLRQPLRGIVYTVATVVFAVVVTWLLATVLGGVAPDFAGSRDGGTGYFAGALFVLFGFSTYVLTVLNWQHWPWTDMGLRQPMVGLCEVAFVFVPTVLLYVVLGVPSVAAEGAPVMSVNVLLGWYYSIIVAIVVTGLTMENWPWRHAGSRARVAAASLVGNVALGTALYVGLLAVCKLIVGAETVALLGDAVHQFPAQLGVCWVAWMILWGNAFGNKPTGLGTAANLAVRVVVTFALAVGTFCLYYYVLAGGLLHEPAVAGALHGNALGFMDWFALVTLLYVVGFESWGLPRPRTGTPTV
ncbi:MAG: hypothetical protein J0I34_11220 [Pseudonocardia sp.]|uniref:hypothetical protein n=1 Tax=unclassified Pseudonocardia TaxID=2619320 RepID=UPI00086F33DB|nr:MULTISPECIES: hypothetical protein [unclassified Pseudonocardia]MBN9109347.1 hypothetical protein [Pseudonocardia sp.]ODU27938.1 MAG: hypothetical protein ABS80_02970 [Pseudonocardia sp. SCN 72-51]ODV08060.1 MAG: hypothetical protein ABT15_05045 [Pseudonocardia sp. SCN 73-27]